METAVFCANSSCLIQNDKRLEEICAQLLRGLICVEGYRDLKVVGLRKAANFFIGVTIKTRIDQYEDNVGVALILTVKGIKDRYFSLAYVAPGYPEVQDNYAPFQRGERDLGAIKHGQHKKGEQAYLFASIHSMRECGEPVSFDRRTCTKAMLYPDQKRPIVVMFPKRMRMGSASTDEYRNDDDGNLHGAQR